MRTISRHWRGRKGDHRSMCDYCGVVWMRSSLRMDRSGKLRCPDEGNGRDSTTLSELNAMGSRRSAQAKSSDGRQDSGGDEYLSHPQSILQTGSSRAALGSSQAAGWWQPTQSGTLGHSGYMWVPNLQRFADAAVSGGDVVQLDPTLQPADVGGVTTFAGDYLKSTHGVLLEQLEYPAVWAVGSFTSSGMMMSVGSGLPGYDDIAIYYDGTSVYGTMNVRYESDDSPGTFGDNYFTASTPIDAGRHLVALWLSGNYVWLQVDGGDPVSTLVSSEGDVTALGLARDIGLVTFGGGSGEISAVFDFYPHYGTLSEVVVSRALPSDDEFVAMRKYFKGIYPELDL